MHFLGLRFIKATQMERCLGPLNRMSFISYDPPCFLPQSSCMAHAPMIQIDFFKGKLLCKWLQIDLKRLNYFGKQKDFILKLQEKMERWNTGSHGTGKQILHVY